MLLPLLVIQGLAAYLLFKGVPRRKKYHPELWARGMVLCALCAGQYYAVYIGQMPAAFGVGVLALPVFLRLAQNTEIKRRRVEQQSVTTPTNKLETPFIIVRVNANTRAMNGEVRQGTFTGMHLEQLAADDLLDLLAELRKVDQRSASVLMTYLDHTQLDDWRARFRARFTKTKEQMAREEALQILGLKEGASDDDVKAAYRRLMSRLHPDAGGTDYLAAKVNMAKDLLLPS
ncbi:MAG TPA: hypothetical protein DIS76_03570 [Rhodospirillaceae bacterium]|nr:hypothetical protein [Rhodospirillaceae bacterium]